ncbi:hypothetical protein [Pedobacter sp.]|uniref:hypothetical protein n=1 Tax=Pedobacter sp. TaxID=1411316 RepID=UPI003BA9617E
MGKVKVKANGTRGLNYTATLNINEAKKNAQGLKKIFSDVGISTSKAFDRKPMSAFQQGVIKLKQKLQEKNKTWKIFK